MRQRLSITLSHDGQPTVTVPFDCMWDLVEYLSYQRAAVSYTYEDSHFTVTFTRQDSESVQRLLDEWASATMPMFQHA